MLVIDALRASSGDEAGAFVLPFTEQGIKEEQNIRENLLDIVVVLRDCYEDELLTKLSATQGLHTMAIQTNNHASRHSQFLKLPCTSAFAL